MMPGIIAAIVLVVIVLGSNVLSYRAGFDDGFGEHETVANAHALKVARADTETERELRIQANRESDARAAEAEATIAGIRRQAEAERKAAGRHKDVAGKALALVDAMKRKQKEPGVCPLNCRLPALR